jgi:glucokinase
MARNFIVADVGGTHIRVARFPVNSQKPSIIKRINTVGPGTPHDRLLHLIDSVALKGEVIAAIAVAAPGPLDPFAGMVYEAPNIPSWINLPLRKIIEDQFHVPVAIGNDANLAALGEWRFGAGIGHHNLVYITVSTGIGGGVIMDDKLLLGVRGLAAELGHITVIPDGPLCGCGQRGHLEAVAAGPAIATWIEQEISQGVPSLLQKGKIITAKDVSEAAHQGDELAKAALTRSATYIGTAIADFLHIFNPSLVIIGGGVSQSGEYFLSPLRTAMNEHVMSKKYLENLQLTLSALGDDVGLMGALALAHTINNAQT